MRIEEFKLKDIPQMLEIEKEAFSNPWPFRIFLYEYYNRDAIYLVARKDDNEIIGYIGGHQLKDEFHITNLAVSEEYRRKGVGGKLLRELISIEKDKGYTDFKLEVRESNDIAVVFYEKYNFFKVEVITDYYRKPVEDAIVMHLNLNNSGFDI